jgi:hypothetical protein
MAARTQEQCCCEQNASYNEQVVYQSYTTYITNTIQHCGPFYAISALEDSVIDVSEGKTGIIEFDSGDKRAVANNITVPKGMTIYSNFTCIELDSGKILAYSRGVDGKAKEPTADES